MIPELSIDSQGTILAFKGLHWKALLALFSSHMLGA